MASHRQIGVAVLSCLLTLFSTSTGYSGTPNVSQLNPVPLVNAPLVPDSAPPGSSDVLVTVNGTGFVSGSIVQWNGNPLATTFVSASQLTAVIPAADLAVGGTGSVRVTNPAPGGGTSNVALFEVRVPFSASSFGESSFDIGSGPNWVIAADVNGDSKLDLVTVLFNASTVAVSLGNGNGTFQSPVSYPVAASPFAVVTADFNRDGKLDLAVSAWGGFVSILLGNGDGTFQPHRDVDLGSVELELVAGDFNQDGNSDLAVVLDSGLVAILLGNGDGTFQSAVNYRAGSDRTFGVVVGDFNEDGKQDLAVTVYSDDAVSVLLGNGDGTFQDAVQYPVFSPGSVVVADLNGDSKLDLTVKGVQDGGITVLLGKGDGTFATSKTYQAQPGLSGLAAVDANGDGTLDLAVPNYSIWRTESIVSVFLGKGDGTFGKRSDFRASRGLVGIAAGDFDGDGRLDLVAASLVDNNLSVLPQLTSVLSRTYLKFGDVKVGDSSTRKVTLSNIGDTSLTINNIKLIGEDTDAFQVSNDCGSELAPGASCTIKIVFKPSSRGPYKKTTVKINDSVAVQKIYLKGNGTN